jgi:hypothetical protein
VSATVRVSTPFVEAPWSDSTHPGIRLRLGFRPTRPLHDAGMRIEPPPSLAWATGAMPAATAAPAPPEEPPGVWSVFQGLRVAPKRSDSVHEMAPNSGVAVLPIRTNPASSSRSISSASSSTGPGAVPRDP